jgi:hypothetical protein
MHTPLLLHAVAPGAPGKLLAFLRSSQLSFLRPAATVSRGSFGFGFQLRLSIFM